MSSGGVRWFSKVIGGHRLFVQGAAPIRKSGKLPILFIHGAFDASWIYRIPMNIFASSGRTVYAINMRGYSYSRYYPIKSLDVGDYLNDIRSIRNALGLKKVIIAGYSSGGLLAQKHVERHGATALVLYDPSHSLEIKRAIGEKSRYREWVEPVVRFWPDESIISEMYGRRVRGDEYLRLLEPFKHCAMSGKLWRAIENVGISVRFDRIHCPVMIIDVHRNSPPTREMADRLNAARYSFEGCSHGSILVGPGAGPTTRAVMSWLSRRCPTGYHKIVTV